MGVNEEDEVVGIYAPYLNKGKGMKEERKETRD